MRKLFDRYTLAGASIALIAFIAFSPRDTIAGILQAIIPQAVPTAKFQGTAAASTKFQGATGSTTNGHCAQYDVTGLLVDSGAACVGAGSGTPGSTVFSSTSSAGPSNTASETSLVGTVTGSTTIAANTFTDGAVFEARAQGFFSLPAVADSITLKMKCGATVIGSASTTLSAGVLSNGTFRFWLTITGRGSGAGGAFMTNGLAEFTGSALTASEIKVLNTSTVAYDFTTSCLFDITAQWGGAQSGELITGTNAAAWFPGAPVTSVQGLTGAVTVTDANLSTSNITTNNVSTSKHGFTPILPNDVTKYLDGTGAYSVPPGTGTASGFVLVEQHTASTSASLNFTTCISSTYDEYEIDLVNIIPVTTTQISALLRFSTDGGATYDSGNNYNWTRFAVGNTGTSGGTGANTTSGITLNDENILATAGWSLNGSYRLYNPGGANFKMVHGNSTTQGTVGSSTETQMAAGIYKITTAVNAFQVLMSSGNITSGTVRCYGIAK